MAKGKTFKLVFEYLDQTPGTWKYGRQGAKDKGNRASGSDVIYLLKAEYPELPGKIVEVTYQVK